MKRLFAFFLLALFAGLIVGIAPLRFGLKQSARAEMRHRLHRQVPQAALTYFTDKALATATWEKEDEFRLDGRLYDVARVGWQDGVRFYACVNDGLEQRLEGQADALANALLDHPQTPQGKLTKALLDWLQGLFFPPDAITAPVYCARIPVPLAAELSAPVTHPYLDCLSPPPRA